MLQLEEVCILQGTLHIRIHRLHHILELRIDHYSIRQMEEGTEWTQYQSEYKPHSIIQSSGGIYHISQLHDSFSILK